MRLLFLMLLAGLSPALSSSLPDSAPSHSGSSSPVDSVDEYIGTANEGQTYPATGMPFAMTQWTPQTREANTKCVSPYYFTDTRIQGFRGSHFLSGSCTQDYGAITLMPLNGSTDTGPVARSSDFDRKSEVATPYKYAVHLDRYGIDAEVTGTTRAGLMRFRFSKTGHAGIVVENNSITGEGEVRVDVDQREVTVTNPVHRIYAGSGKLAGFSGYSVVRFDHPFHVEDSAGTAAQKVEGALPKTFVQFDLAPGETVEAKIGTSFTSLQEARNNLNTEIPGWDFDRVAAQVKEQWEIALGRIKITADPVHKRIFYTALYHTMLLPRVFSDVSGSYPGFAGEGKIEYARGYTYYTDFSLWDTFRAVHPLFTILDPHRELDMVKSLVAMGQQGGFLPIYPAWNSYTSEMIGDHADAVIGDAFAKGIRDFDVAEAYRIMKKNATELPETSAAYLDGRGRRGLSSYLKYGYIPLEDHLSDAFHPNEQVSRTLEYAYDDSIVGDMAAALGHTDDSLSFHNRAQNYRHVIDPTTGFARGRRIDGSWETPFDPTKPDTAVTEGLPFQYTFFVPQDLSGLIQLVGGKEAFISKLDALFAGDYYNHGNEPSHHIAYLYDNAGAAWKTQKQVRYVMDTQYSDTPGGLAGNDDCGQMSAWYIMSAIGFYPVAPGTPVYQIGTPLFDEITIRMGNGRQLHILARGAAVGNRYIQSATLNGKALNRYSLTHSEVMTGGELIFKMSSQPNPDWPLRP